MHPEARVRLSTLHPGDAARVLDVEGDGAFRRRLLDMGFVSGAPVRVIRHAPLRNPTEYCVSGTHVTLRDAEASRIIVTHVSPHAVCRRPHGRGFGRLLGRGGHGRRRGWKKDVDGSR